MLVTYPAALQITTAKTTTHFEQILQLQHRYHRDNVQAIEQEACGFLYTRYTLAFLEQMAGYGPQVIAVHNNCVVGYNLTLSAQLVSITPHLKSMFEAFEHTQYGGRLLNTYSYVIGGQVCVDKTYRGHGLLNQLYNAMRSQLDTQYELCVTDVAQRNQPSLHAHLKTGFDIANTYSYDGENWHTMVWDWRS